ncbi:hypothetical protein [Blastococcus sp. URHD0036]|uniref:AMIN-like domain-containing (lipo)protein n=1 Tax=Blastococcus sp. URHD0036 TaxID=1380356 RepID=UPI00068D91A4|nr:hypothetical protein [Blastococcus sp. URHD0036]
MSIQPTPRRTRCTRRLVTALAGGAVLGATALAAPASAAPAAGCATAWGSLPEAAGPLGTGRVDDIRAGRHDCFDRLVVDVDGAGGRDVGYDVRYVSVFTEDGRGDAVPLRGAADLQVVVRSPAYDHAGHSTYDPAPRTEAVDVSGYSTFRQVAWGGSFEGYSTIGLGVRARLPFRVTVLDGPGNDARVVIDVAHTW